MNTRGSVVVLPLVPHPHYFKKNSPFCSSCVIFVIFSRIYSYRGSVCFFAVDQYPVPPAAKMRQMYGALRGAGRTLRPKNAPAVSLLICRKATRRGWRFALCLCLSDIRGHFGNCVLRRSGRSLKKRGYFYPLALAL